MHNLWNTTATCMTEFLSLLDDTSVTRFYFSISSATFAYPLCCHHYLFEVYLLDLWTLKLQWASPTLHTYWIQPLHAYLNSLAYLMTHQLSASVSPCFFCNPCLCDCWHHLFYFVLAQIEKINSKGNPKYNQPGRASADRVEIKKWCSCVVYSSKWQLSCSESQ